MFLSVFSRSHRTKGNMQKIRSGLQSDRLAAMFALPHEYKPVRLPTVPAVLTATVDLMSDDTRVISAGTQRRYSLCRDVCFPLWSDRYVNACGGLSAIDINLPATIGSAMVIPSLETKFSTTRIIDGVTMSQLQYEDTAVVLGRDDNTILYIPPGSYFQCVLDTNGVGANANCMLEVESRSYASGDWRYTRFHMDANANNYAYVNLAGSTGVPGRGLIVQGPTPVGFTQLLSMRVIKDVALAAPACKLYFGYSSGTAASLIPSAPQPSELMFIPSFPPPEFRNSTLPFRKTRMNASAVLMTNVSEVLTKEGTVLGARLSSSTVDMHAFSATDINSSHPSQRYFGALENGLYTFTAPTANVDSLDDCVGYCSGVPSPTFDYLVDCLYNAVVLSDLSATSTTTMAISLYSHLEFACTSALFQIDVSPMTIETLHKAEVKLLKMGYFHENSKQVAQVRNDIRAWPSGRARMPPRAMQQVRMVQPKQQKKSRKVKPRKASTKKRSTRK